MKEKKENNEFSIEHHERTRTVDYCPNISMETSTAKQKIVKQMKHILNLLQQLDLRSSKNMLLFKTYLFVTRRKIKQQYKSTITQNDIS